MQRICVYCGSNKGARPEYADAARALGNALVARGMGLVYGGGSVGLMGVIADTVLAAGGEAIGVLPRGLFAAEVAHPHLTTLHEVASMHERKALMADLADGFIAMPGGFGTLDELFEIMTWAQLRLHVKPVGLLNIAGYFTPLLDMLAHDVREGFIMPRHAALLLHATTPTALLDLLAGATPAALPDPSADKPER